MVRTQHLPPPNSQVRPGPLGRVSCVAGAVWGTAPQMARVGCGSSSGRSGCCEHRERLAALDALLSRVVEQWLSSSALGSLVRGNCALVSTGRVNDFPGCARTGCLGDAAGVGESEAGVPGGTFSHCRLVAAEQHDDQPEYPASQHVDDFEQHPPTQPSPCPAVGESAGQPRNRVFERHRITRLAYRAASSGLWVTTTRVCPDWLRPLSSRPIASPFAESSAPVGSSASSRAGRDRRRGRYGKQLVAHPSRRNGGQWSDPTAADGSTWETGPLRHARRTARAMIPPGPHARHIPAGSRAVTTRDGERDDCAHDG